MAGAMAVAYALYRLYRFTRIM